MKNLLGRALLCGAFGVLMAAGCVDALDEDFRPCPCAEGWKCCQESQICVGEGASCAAFADSGPGADNGPGSDATGTDTQIVCVPDKTECVDLGSRRTCNASGTAYLPDESCPPQRRCEGGSCVSAGTVTGSLWVSLSVKAKELILDIDPGEFTTRLSSTASFLHDAPGLVAPPSKGPEGCKQLNVESTTQPEGTPFDAGAIQLGGLSGLSPLVFDSETGAYSGSLGPFDSYYSPFTGFGKTITFSGAGAGLVHGPFSGSLTLAPERRFTRPGPREKLAIAKNSELELTWSGATGTGQVGVHLLCLPETIPPGTYTPPVQVRCDMDDDGSFTVPASIMSLFASYPKVALFMMIDDYQDLKADGLSEGQAVVSYRYWPAFPIELK